MGQVSVFSVLYFISILKSFSWLKYFIPFIKLISRWIFVTIENEFLKSLLKTSLLIKHSALSGISYQTLPSNTGDLWRRRAGKILKASGGRLQGNSAFQTQWHSQRLWQHVWDFSSRETKL